MGMMIKAVALAAAMASMSAQPAEKDLRCHLTFATSEWSALYASAEGKGTVECEDGTSMPVAISARGAGITAGKWQITDGKGVISRVASIEEVPGNYLAVSGDIGMVKAGTARVLTKGKVSLALAGTGKGFDIGVAVTRFSIKRATQP